MFRFLVTLLHSCSTNSKERVNQLPGSLPTSSQPGSLIIFELLRQVVLRVKTITYRVGVVFFCCSSFMSLLWAFRAAANQSQAARRALRSSQ